MKITQIRKRSGEVVVFESEKIQSAVHKAFSSTIGSANSGLVERITSNVMIVLEKQYPDRVPGVEDIQDIVEKKIAEEGHFEVAKSYILYRDNRNRERDKEREKTAKKAEKSKLQMTKRDGSSTDFSLYEIEELINSYAKDLKIELPTEGLLRDIKYSVFDGISASEVNKVVVMVLRSRIERDPIFSKLAARLLHHGLYKDVIGVEEFAKDFDKNYRKVFVDKLKYSVKEKQLDKKLLDFDLTKISKLLKPERDQLFTYLGAQTLYDRYYRRDYNQNILEVPQYFWMRVAMGLALNEPEAKRVEKAEEFYEVMSLLHYIPSTPTLFHSGTPHSQMSSCYLNTINDDLNHIFKVVGDNAQLAKWSGGIGTDVTDIRGTGALIHSTNVPSQGVVPFLKILDATTAAINRSGKRRGAAAIYLECWHYDFEDFLELRKNTGDERRRTPEMNTASWIPDLFMKRVREDGDWVLFSPEETPELHNIFGKEFEKKYVGYEQKVEAGEIALFKKLKAKNMWRKMISMLFETGHPWITWKDACNVRSPQAHVGVIHTPNLCTESTLNTSKDETAVCNLGSVQLKNHVKSDKSGIDYEQVARTVKTAMRMLDNVVDLNFYPTVEAKNSNLKHRPVGLGIMGYQDALFELGMAFDSAEALQLTDELMELVSYNAIKSSMELAKERGSYKSFKGSKWDRGMLPLDTLDLLEEERGVHIPVARTSRLDWDSLRKDIKKNGMRNSNTMAIAPTATISNVSGSLPSIEPIYKNIYVKSNISGEFTIANEYLINELKDLGLWTPEMLDKLKYYDGSLLSIPEIPQEIKDKYKEAFEIDPEWVIKHAAYRGKWIDQSQSINIFSATQSGKKISEIYQYAWEMGLKTTYYLRTLGASAIEKSTIDINKKYETEPEVVTVDEVVIEEIDDTTTNIEVSEIEVTFSPEMDMMQTTSSTAELCVIGDPDCEACQ